MNGDWMSLVNWPSKSSAVQAVKRHRNGQLSHLAAIWLGTRFLTETGPWMPP